MSADLESFIEQQKAKLARERELLEKETKNTVNAPPTMTNGIEGRQQWDKDEQRQQFATDNVRAPSADNTSLPLGSYEDKRRQLLAERQKEYNELQQQHKASDRKRLKTPEHTGLALGNYDNKRKQLQEERQQEYNRMIGKNTPRANAKENIPPGGEDGPVGILAIGGYDDRRKKLQEERSKEYNEFLSQNQTRRRANNEASPHRDESPAQSTPRRRDRHSAEGSRSRERARDYDDYPDRQNDDRRARDLSDDEDDYARELRRRPTKKGWATPTYEEILEKKRLEERNYRKQAWVGEEANRDRRYDDPEIYSGMKIGDTSYMRSSRSDGHLNQRPDPEEERRFRDLDRELDSKRVRFEEDVRRRDYNARDLYFDRPTRRYDLDDDDYSQRLNHLKLKYGPELFEDVMKDLNRSSRRVKFDDRDPPDSDYPSERSRPRNRDERAAPPARSEQRAAPPARSEQRTTPRRNDVQPEPYQATLMIGGGFGKETRVSADIRKKEEYRKELERQMEEARKQKQKEKELDYQTAQPKNETRSRATPRENQRPRQDSSSPPPRRYNDDDLSPRRVRPDDIRSRNGILDSGWGRGLYNTPPLPPTDYRQHTELLAGGPNLFSSPLEEAYNYYASRNLLEPPQFAGASQPVNGLAAPTLGQPPVQQPTSYYPSQQVQRPAPAPAPAPGPSRTPRAAPNTNNGGYPFPTEADNKDEKSKQKLAYQQELQRQIEEQKQKKQKERLEREKYEAKLDAEIANYDPFGRGGGGAPMRDAYGNIVANRKPTAGESEAAPPAAAAAAVPSVELPDLANFRELRAGGSVAVNTAPLSNRTAVPLLDLDAPQLETSPTDAEANFARGGHGIFGNPKSDQQKTAQQRYQEELKRQIDEKRKQDAIAVQKQKEEEARLLQKIAEDQKKMQDELDKEKRKEREKQEAAQRQQEEQRRLAEEKRKAEEQRQAELDRARDEKLRREQDEAARERREATKAAEREAARSASPPIPTLKTRPKQDEERRTDSPPVPTLQNKLKSPSPPLRSSPQPATPAPEEPPAERAKSRVSSRTSNRARSADALAHLASLRQQLESERERLNLQLHKEKTDPVVFDPRVPSIDKNRGRDNIDVFRATLNKEPVSVRRNKQSEPANPQAAQDFANLRNKSNSATRKAVQEDFPDHPVTRDALEMQQRALLLEQEKRLKDMKKTPMERALPNMDPKDMGLFRETSNISANMLDSESAFIDVPNDELPPRAKTSARKNPARKQSYPQYNRDRMGSVTSLDPDAITRKNEARLRKLKDLSGDDVSIGDPDDVLDKFMATQRHNRPPSGRTLVDDSWLHNAHI